MILPNSDGTFNSPADGAKFMLAVTRMPQIPLRPRTKIAFLDGWQDKGATTPQQIDAYAAQYPDCNFGSIAKPDGCFVFEADSTDVRNRFEKATGKSFTRTLIVLSRPDGSRGHRYYLQTPESVALGNVAQHKVIGGDFSIRVDDEYCVSPGSVSPVTGEQYRVSTQSVEPAVAITAEEIEWFKSQVITQPRYSADPEDSQITEGSRNSRLTSLAGAMRRQGCGLDEIRAALKFANDRCVPPVTDDEIESIARSISRYEAAKDERPIIGGKRAGDAEPEAVSEPEIETGDALEYPKFPTWVMKGTSLYEGFVKPVCDASQKIAELVWMPAVQVMLNQMAYGVGIQNEAVNLNLYLGLISPPGKFFKSTSCDLAHEFWQHAGLLDYSGASGNANSKTLVFSPGSSEGFGRDAQAKNCKKAIMYHDELRKFISKAGIDGANLLGDLLTMYGSGLFQNVIKSRKDSFCHNPNTYTFGWLWCTTRETFAELWGRLGGATSGLDDRVFLLLAPPEPRPLDTAKTVDLKAGAAETRLLLDKAIAQGKYRYEDMTPFQIEAEVLGSPRALELAEKLALYFAVDLGRDEIDIDCMERALALVQYRNQVQRYLHVEETETMQGQIQSGMIRVLRQNGGKMRFRDFQKALHYERYGTDLWTRAFEGLVKMQVIGYDAKARPKTVCLLKQDDAG